MNWMALIRPAITVILVILVLVGSVLLLSPSARKWFMSNPALGGVMGATGDLIGGVNSAVSFLGTAIKYLLNPTLWVKNQRENPALAEAVIKTLAAFKVAGNEAS